MASFTFYHQKWKNKIKKIKREAERERETSSTGDSHQAMRKTPGPPRPPFIFFPFPSLLNNLTLLSLSLSNFSPPPKSLHRRCRRCLLRLHYRIFPPSPSHRYIILYHKIFCLNVMIEIGKNEAMENSFRGCGVCLQNSRQLSQIRPHNPVSFLLFVIIFFFFLI